MIELEKQYNPTRVEPEISQHWNDAAAFRADPAQKGAPYCIVIPPPNVTAALHMGHALNNTLQDVLIRWHRMLGANVVWIPGTDHAGIATQTVVEKRVLADEGKKRTDFQRDEFVDKIRAWKDQYEQRITDQLKLMGCSCDWDRQRFTMDPVCARAVRQAFFVLFKEGLIYRGKRLVNWDPATQTALADDEVEMRDIDGHFWYMKYPLVEPVTDDGQSVTHVTVATTRPETMLGDTAVAINPDDPQAAVLVGKKIRLPIVNRVIPIIADSYVVLPDPDSDDAKARYSTGVLKVTPAHDPHDWDVWQRHENQIALGAINVMAPDGSISDQHGWPSDDMAQADRDAVPLGLDRYEAREAIVDWFRRNHLLEDVRPYRHAVGHSYRSHVPIEPYLSDQWYVKVTDDRLANAALRALADDQVTRHSEHEAKRTRQGKPWEGKLRFTPARYAKTFQNWHENIRDWCISRQLWWGHQIPVWSKQVTEPKSTMHKTVALTPRFLDDPTVAVKAYDIVGQTDVDVRTLDENSSSGPTHLFVCLQEDDAQLIADLEADGFQRDPDVLDTWFSSALWPFSTLGWPEDTPELQTWNPGNVLCTAREIITLWVSRMVMTNLYFRDRLPFTDVFIHAMIQDGQGRKMSKSLGNGVDPLDIIDSHGADAMRYTLAVMTTQTQDVRLPVTADAQTGHNTSDKFDLGRNFANKLWNATRFALTHLESPGPEISNGSSGQTDINATLGAMGLADRWVLSRLARTVSSTNTALERYEFNGYAQGLYDFFWRDLCDWYIEAIKPTVSSSMVQRRVLALCIDASLRLLHPVMPFVTEKLWQRLNDVEPIREVSGVALHPSGLLVHASWPQVSPELVDPQAEAQFTIVEQVVTALRQVRTTHKVPPRRVVTFSAQAQANTAQQIVEHRQLIETLAHVQTGQVGPSIQSPDDAAVTLIGQTQLYVHGLLDRETERIRLTKRLDDLHKQIHALTNRLSNPSYVEKAPAHLVQQTRQQLATAQKEAGSLSEQLTTK